MCGIWALLGADIPEHVIAACLRALRARVQLTPTPRAPVPLVSPRAGERHHRTTARGYVRRSDTVNKLWNETGPRYA